MPIVVPQTGRIRSLVRHRPNLLRNRSGSAMASACGSVTQP